MRLSEPAPAGLSFSLRPQRFDGRTVGDASRIDRFAVSSGVRLPARRARTASLAVPAYWALVTSIVLIAAGIAGFFALRAKSWAVMTDELQVVRLAESIAGRLSPVPAIHGVYYGALSQLYPLLLAPLFGTLNAPAAETAAHALNAVLLPSAAWPAYLLARSVTGSRRASIAAAAMTAFTPWLVLTSTLLTENAAYPAFVWAIYLCHRTLVAPSARNDLLALLGLGLAFFARTQLLVVAIAFPVVVLLHAGPRRALLRHRTLAAVYGIAAILAVALFARGSLGAVVGNYSVPFTGDILPQGLWAAAASHLVHVVVGCAVVPFVLTGAWAVLNVVRPDGTSAHAFALLCIVLVPLLTFEVASFDLRFTPHAFDQDRYLFYLVPLFAVGTTAALTSRQSARRLAAAALAAVGLFVWFVLQFGAYDDRTVIFWAAPAAAVHTVFPADWVLVAAAAAAVVAALVLLLRAPRAALPVVAVAVSVLGAAQALYVFERYADSAMTRPPAMPLARNWIDQRVPAGASVALVPAPRDTAVFWWEAELWNKRVEHVLSVDGGPTFSPFPATKVRVDYRTGTLSGSSPGSYLVLSGSEKRFRPVEVRRLWNGPMLKLVQVARPYRLEWATKGMTPDGWTVAGQPATVRVYGADTQRIRRVAVVLAASNRAALPLDFTLRARGPGQSGWVDPGGARPPVNLSLCVPARGFVDITLTTQAEVRIPDGRLVGLHLDRLAVSNGPAGCQVSSR
jgi:hypothetical protein